LLTFSISLQELAAMKARVEEMEQEAAKLRDMTAEVEKTMNGPEEGWLTCAIAFCTCDHELNSYTLL
jgi:hypothetical protein